MMHMMSLEGYSFWNHQQKPVRKQTLKKETVFTMSLCTTQRTPKALRMW